MAAHVVEAIDVAKQYDGREVILKAVSFFADRSEFVVIHGKSGCGKTTLLNILGGLDRPSGGDVLIDGSSITNLSEDRLARLRLEKMGFVFQDYNLLADLTVRENIALPLRLSHRGDGDRVDSLLDKFGILDIADDPAARISGGEAQRTAIARAMMNEPAILLADEPTGNLDRENAGTVIDAFELVRREFGTTVILATHDESLAARASKRVHIADGKAKVEQNG